MRAYRKGKVKVSLFDDFSFLFKSIIESFFFFFQKYKRTKGSTAWYWYKFALYFISFFFIYSI